MTVVGVAPRGFNGTTLGDSPRHFRAADDARPDAAGLQRLRESPAVLGVPVRAPEAGRLDRAGDRRDQRSVSRDRQRRRSAAAEGHERAADGRVQGEADHDRAGPSRAEQLRQRSAHAADHPARRHRHRAADRVREHREPAAGARRRPRRGNGGAPVDRREPPAADHAAADRIDPARGVRRDRRPVRREMDDRS